MNIKEFEGLEDRFAEIADDFLLLSSIEPINEKEQKKLFLKGTIKNPVFEYRRLKLDLKELEKEISTLEIPQGDFKLIFEKKKKRYLNEIKILQHLGNRKIVSGASINIYGKPSKTLVLEAIKILKKPYLPTQDKRLSARVMKKSLKKALKAHNIKKWKVKLSKKKLTTVSIGKKRITVCRNRKFSADEIRRLPVHEVGVHVLRAINGETQPLKIFEVGFPGYLSTEEGLTSYFEEATGNSNQEVMRNYAGRVIAVDSVIRGLDFRGTFLELKKYGFNDEESWGLCVRAYRGGGFIKDHVYLQGYFKIKKYVKEKKNLKILFVGKVGIEDLPFITKLLKKNIIHCPEHLPIFLKNI